jgi:hypothetical protein
MSRVATNQSADVSVFDRAQSRRASNDNHYIRLVCDDPEDMPSRQKQKPFKGDELRAEIPSDKAAAREWLSAMGVGASVSLSAACANAGLPVDRGWRGEMKEQPEPKAWHPRKRAANSNEPQNWPLLEALRRDGREYDIPAVVRYDQLFRAVTACPFGIDAGIGADGEDGFAVEYRSLRLTGKRDVDRAAAAGWPGDKVPGGEISYRERRTTTRQTIHMGRRVGRSEDGEAPISSLLDRGYREGGRHDKIDGIPVLLRLREALDVNPFGDRIFSLWDLLNLAALGSASLTDIGGALGFKHKARSREAKVRIYAAVDILRDEWRRIEDRQAEAAEACHRRVLARRRELEAERAAYLGRAA